MTKQKTPPNKTIRTYHVSIVVPMRNSSTTVMSTLDSIEKQKYPVEEIVIIDNASKDNSVSLVQNFAKHSKIPIQLIARDENKGLGASYNEGVEKAKSLYVILMHSDCSLPSDQELEKLMQPFLEDKEVVATYPTILLLEKVWESYDFWEKYFFARIVGKRIAGFATKFDCVKKEAYTQIGGVDIENYGVGNEDGDLHEKLLTIGKVVKSKAIVTHVHYLGSGYSFQKMLIKTRGYSRTYGRIIRVKGAKLFPSQLVFLVKPGIAILPFLPYLHIVGLIILIMFSFSYTAKMFMSRLTLTDPRILIVPFINIFILYYETFWTIEGFFFGKNKIE